MAANVYYSVSPFGTGDIKTGSPTISISSGVATLSVGQTGNIGQGDRITYNTSSVCYISGVTDSTHFSVVTATGGTPSNVSGQTVNSIAHEYASLSAAEAGASDANHVNNANLTAADVVLNICCYYDHDDQTADTTACTIDGYTTDATRYINIYTPTGSTQSINSQRHAGVWSDLKYRLSLSSEWSGCIVVLDDFVRIDGLQIGNSGSKAEGPCGIRIDIEVATSVTKVSNCIVRESGTGTADASCIGIRQLSTSMVHIWNNIIYDWGQGFFNSYISGTGCGVILYNNTVADCSVAGIHVQGAAAGVYRLANNIVQGAATNYNLEADSGMDYSATNISEDTSSPQVGLRTIALTFLNEAGNDFRLGSSDTSAINAGTDLSGDGSLAFTTDIIGTTRSSWDIGAFEYVAAGGGGGASIIPRIAYYNRLLRGNA